MSVYEFGPFQLDVERLLLLANGEPVALGPKVVETLLALVEHPGEVLTKSALLDRIWPEGYVDEANLAQNVYVLRKSLRAHWDADAIETIPRRGYRFSKPVGVREQTALAAPVVLPARRRTTWFGAAAAVLALVLLGAAGFAFAPHRAQAAVALSPDGARLYEIGRYYWNLRSEDGIRKSMQYFARVIDTDPRNPRGYSALAAADAIMGDYMYGPAAPKVYYARARAYAQKAIAIDPNYGEAYAVLGMIASEKGSSDKDMAQASASLQRAVQLDPTSGPAHEWYGVVLYERGNINQAYRELRTAADLDPLSVATASWLGNAAYLERRYDDAIAYAHQTLDLQPQRHDAWQTLGLAYEARGDTPRAIDAFEHLGRACASCRAQAAALMAELYARQRHLAEARAELAIAQANAKEVEPDDLAVALAAIGQRGMALSLLRRSQAGYVRAEMANDPRFAVLRSASAVARVEKTSG